MTTAAENHRRVAGTFTDRVRGVARRGWDVAITGAPAGRLVTSSAISSSGFPGSWLAAPTCGCRRGRRWPTIPSARGRSQCDAVQAVLDDPATASKVLADPHIGEVPLPEAIDRFYTADVFMHTWDLARATGQDDTLDPEYCAVLLDGMVPFEEAMRGSGQYGPRVPVPDDAPVQARMLGFIGRDPNWQPT